MTRHEFATSGPFLFESGESLNTVTLSYYTSDREYTPGETVVWICHALTGNADPEDWWPGVVGKGKAIDPDKCFVVCPSMLCSSYGTCGPASVNPLTGKPYLLDFPKTTIRDMLKACILVRKHLGIHSIDCLIGPSIGGFIATEWLVTEPDIISKAFLLATYVRVLPYLTAFNESMRMALLADPSFLAALDLKGGEKGLVCARSMALLSYRTPYAYNLTQKEDDPDTLFADRAASYQRHQGRKLIDRYFDAYSYWYLSYAVDSMNIGRGRGGVEKALSSIRARCKVVYITSDQIFTKELCEEYAGLIPDATCHGIESIFGHDGFLIENDAVASIISDFINQNIF